MAMVNIPSTNTDPEYRYKMPRLISKIEGRGNGIKTCIVNMGDVARALNCPPQYAAKWFGCELGTKSHYIEKEGDFERCLIDGSHDISVFQGLLDEFIDKYVCCESCHLPEVDMYIAKGIIHGKCKACGWDEMLDNRHRVAHFITKNPPDDSGSRLKGYAGGKIVKAAEFDKVWDYESDDGDLTEDASSASSYEGHMMKKQKKVKEKKDKKGKKEKKDKKEKKERKQEMRLGVEKVDESVREFEDERSIDQIIAAKIISKTEGAEQTTRPAALHVKGYGSREVDTVIKTLRTYVEKSGINMTVEEFFDELRLAQLAEVFDHKMRLYVALEALLGPRMDRDSVLAQKDHLAKAIDRASVTSFDVLWAFDAYIEAHPSMAKGFPMVLKTIYDEDWAEEDDILEYYGSDLFRAEPGFLTAQSYAAPFLRWLSTVGPEDEDEEDE